MRVQSYGSRRQPPVRRVFDPGEIQACRRDRRRGASAVAAGEQFGNPLRRVFAFADIDQGADDVPHHVLQKGIGAKIENQHVIVTDDIGLMQRLQWRLGLTFGGAKSREVVLSQQQPRGTLHRVDIERTVVPADAAMIERRPHRMVAQQIAVAARESGETRVELRSDRLRPAYRHGVWQVGIGAAHPGMVGTLDVAVEMRDLGQGMDACVGASGAGDAYRRAGNLGQGPLQRVLHGVAVRL